MSYVPWSILPRLSQLVNLVALLVATWCTMSALGYRDRKVLAGGALLGAAAGLLTEPVFRTMYLGQINLVLMALIIWDLRQKDSRWWMGIATGFAAGIKLVPLIFILYLLLIRKFRQAAVALGAFLGTVLLGFVILPGDSRDWWLNGLFIQDGRTGFVGWGGNQSLRAIATRLAGSIDAGTVPWVIAGVIVTVGGLLCAARLYRAGHPMLGILTTALIGLLDSPISWDHHWVWVVPGMMAAVHYAVRAWRAGRRGRAAGCAALAGGMFLVFAPWPGILWSVLTTGPGNFTHGLIWSAPNTPVTKYSALGDQPWFLEYHWRTFQLLAGNAYVLSGLLLLVILGFTALTAAPLASAPPPPSRRKRPPRRTPWPAPRSWSGTTTCSATTCPRSRRTVRRPAELGPLNPAIAAVTGYGRCRGYTSSALARSLIRGRSGVSVAAAYRQAAASSAPNRAPMPARNRRASPPSPRQDASHARTSASVPGSVQSRSRSATWPAASMTKPSSPPPRIACTRPALAAPARMLAELNRAPSSSAATACPASCHAVRTAAALAGA